MTAAERRETIEAKATEVFAERGFHGASVEEIARRSGISVPVVYDHFASKQDLYRRLLERHFADLREIWGQHFPGAPGGPDALAAALSDWFGYVQTHPFAWRMLFRDTTGDPAIETIHADVAAASREALLPMTGAALKLEGERLEVEMAWESVRGVIQTLALWWLGHQDVPRERVVAAAMDAIWLGLEHVTDGRRWPRK